MAEPTSQFSLPRSKSEWRAARKRYECQTMTIHNLKAPNSASEIRREQFLALNVIWPNQRQTQAEDYLTSIGFQKGVFEEKRKAMKARKAWEMYLEILKDNARAASLRKGKPWTLDSALSDELGGFQLVLISQLEVLALPDDIGTDQSKVTVTSRPDVSPPIAPVTPRLERLRVRTQNPSYVSTEPATPVRQDVFRPTEEMSARKSEDTRVPDAADEQIVNTALVEFLNALWANEKRIAGWSLKRKEFRFHPQGPGAGFVARTDGHLQVSVQSAGILEVKARARPRKDPADHKIEMQESAQMALWIAQEPNSHWTSPKKGPHGKQTIYHRVLISQDRHQIFLTIAEYTKQYIEYLHDPDNVNINDDFTLTMRMFGDYNTADPGDMELLGVLVKVILMHAAKSVRTSSARSLFTETGEPSSVMENVTRSVESMNINPKQPSSGDSQGLVGNEPQGRLPKPGGQRYTGSGRAPFDSPSRRGSPHDSAESAFQPSHRHGNDGFRPTSPSSAGRQPYEFRGYNDAEGRAARPVSPYPQPPEHVGRGGRGSPDSSTTSRSSSREPPTSSAARRYRSHDKDTLERPRDHRSTSNSPLRHGGALDPDHNRGSSARGASSGYSSLHPNSTSRSDYKSSDRYY